MKSVTFDRDYLEAGGTKSIQLTPKFMPDQSHYSAAVPSALKTVYVKPVPGASAKAVIIANGSRTEAGSDFVPVALRAGRNDIRIQVTSSDGVQHDYDVQVTRSSPVLSSILAGLPQANVSTGEFAKARSRE